MRTSATSQPVLLFLTGLVALLAIGVRADAPHVYVISGARIVTVAGPPIESGTVVIRNGLVDAVGAAVGIPPGAHVIEGKGLTVYPGLIDMGSAAGLDVPAIARPQDPKTREEVERWKRSLILRPQLDAARHVKADAPDLAKAAAAGITTILATPPGEVVKGRSALINVMAPEDDPQIGAVADPRRGLMIVRTPVALHVAFTARPEGSAYPESLMGVIAFVRQSFLDAQHYQIEQTHYARVRRGIPRPVYDDALDAMQPALARAIPVAFQADSAREIRRALSLAREFKLDPLVSGAREADQVVADLKAQNARVLFSLNYPVRPTSLAPDADESLRTLRGRANAPKAPAALEKAGILFAFQSGGLKEPKDFVKNAARAVKEGLPADAAVRALTLNAATIAGVGDQMGSIEKGKAANLIVTDGDLFAEKTKIAHVFIDGRMVRIEPPKDEKGERTGQRR